MNGTPPLTTSEKIDRVLRRLPQSGPIHARACDLLTRHRRCTLTALRSGPKATRAEAVQLVEMFRRHLLAELGDLLADADLARTLEGGVA